MSTLLQIPPALAFADAEGGVAEAATRARAFARQHVLPVALQLDARLATEHDYFPWDLVHEGARHGLLSAALPGFLGGGGLGIAPMAAVIEELCAVDAGVANIFGAHGLGMLPLMLLMDVDLAQLVLGHVVEAERTERPILCAFAITEPSSGSDVEELEGLRRGELGTHAVAVSGGYELTGRKVFISNGNVAEYVVVFAALDRRAPHESWTAFVVQRETPGFSCARVENKMGQRACPAAELVFDGAFVPERMRVGVEGAGWELTRQTLAVSRGPVGAIATGVARGAFEATLEHVRRARFLGTPGADAPWIDDALARMVVQIRTARAAYLEAARFSDRVLFPGKMAQRMLGGLVRDPTGLGKAAVARLVAARRRDPKLEAAWSEQAILGATAKVAGSDAAMAVTTTALDIVPPHAGTLRARVEKAFRDAKLTQIYEGTNQINLRSIAHEGWLAGG